MKSGIIIGTILALLIVIGAGAVWVFKSPLTSAKQAAQTVQTKPYIVDRTDEVPLAVHREQSLVAAENHTSLIPWGIALDPYHGFVWVAEPGCDPDTGCPPTTQGALGQYALSDGTFISDFNEPPGYSSPLFTAVDDAGNVWFTQPTINALGEFNHVNETWNKWSLKKGSSPFDLIFDKLGNLWFTDPGTNSIGFMDTLTHTIVENPIPTAASSPYGITLDIHGTMWFAENSSGINQIASFQPTPSGKIKITEYTVTGLRPHLITSDKAGNIWFSEGFAGFIGKFNPHDGTSITFSAFGGTCASPGNCTTGTHVSGIYVDATTGNIWFTDSLSHRVGYIIPSTGQVVTRTLPNVNAHPHDGLIIDGSDRIWFTSEFAQTLTMWPANSLK